MLNWIKAPLFLMITTIIALLGIGGLFIGSQPVAIVSIVLTGLGFANVFPLIFSITVDKNPEYTNELSGLMVTAIIGGAVLPLIMGKVADMANVTTSFVVPGVAILYSFIVALKTRNA